MKGQKFSSDVDIVLDSIVPCIQTIKQLDDTPTQVKEGDHRDDIENNNFSYSLKIQMLFHL